MTPGAEHSATLANTVVTSFDHPPVFVIQHTAADKYNGLDATLAICDERN